MTPESPLFPTYEAQLDEEIAERDFNLKIIAALDTIDASEAMAKDKRLMLDSWSVSNSIADTGLEDAKNIAHSIHSGREHGNSEQRPTVAYISTSYDPFERSGVQCASNVAKLEPPGYGQPYTVYRLVMTTDGQRTLPDGRGYYVARSRTDGTVTMFKVCGVGIGTRQPAKAGQDYSLLFQRVDKQEREKILEELEKASAALPPNEPPQRRW
jgi:hypothetical protein